MAKNFSESLNVARMHASSTMKAAQKAAELREQGHSVTDLTVGEPDFDTPKFIKEYAVEGISKGITKYTASSGMPDLRQSVAEFYAMCFGAEVDPARVAAACGGKQALFNAACTILNPGDDVLIPKPYWVTFPEISTFCVANNVFIDTMETGFVLNADQVKRSITDRTKLLIINSPNNPTGRVIPPDEMVKIVETCSERDVYVLTDECYLFFTYKPTEPYSLAVLPKEMREYVCIAGSFSKTFAMTGWRSGYTIANDAWTKAMVKLQSHSATHPTSFVQYACAKALRDTEKTLTAIASMLAEYAERRAWFIPALNTVDGFKCALPEGAFYAFVDVRGLLGDRFKTSADVAEHLLNEAYGVVTDGAAFGAEGFLRLSYAASMETLRGAVDRMHRVFGKK